MSANLTGVMADLITVFYTYSGREGDKYKLNKRELKNMLKEQLELDVSTWLTRGPLCVYYSDALGNELPALSQIKEMGNLI